MPKVPPAHEEQRKGQILGAAISAFGCCGLHETRIDDIAEKAGLSKGAIYSYFPSKIELFYEAAAFCARATIAEVEATFAEGDTALDRCDKIAGFFASKDDASWQQGSVVELELRSLSSRDEKANALVLEGRRNWMELVSGIIKDGVKAGEFRSDVDPEAVASLLIAAFRGMLLDFEGEEKEMHPGRLIEALMDIVREGLLSK